jgi:YVTN family beta-propeller protein
LKTIPGLMACAAVLLFDARPARAAACDVVYVSNEASGDLSIIDARARTVSATIPLGKRPRGLRLSPDERTLYVALSGSPMGGPNVDESTLPPADKAADGIGVVDVATRQLVRILRGVSDPEQLAVSADGKLLFVASEDRGELVVLAASDGTVRAHIPVGAEAEGVNLAPDGKVVYVTSEAEHRVTVIDAHSLQPVARVEVGTRPRSTAFSPDGGRAYVLNEAGGNVSVIDARTHRPVTTLPLPPGSLPMSGAVSPDGTLLYMSTGRAKQVLAVDLASGAVRGSVESGARPWGLALSADGTRLYAANGPSNDVAIIDARAMSVIARVAVGQKPWGVTCHAEARRH